MPLFPIILPQITETNLHVQLWFYRLMHNNIQEQLYTIETELLAFQIRYQTTVTSQPIEAEDVIHPKSGVLNKTFRKLAQLLHPDKAINAEDAQKRTELIAKASAAVQNQNLDLLMEMLNNYQSASLSNSEQLQALKFQIHTLYSKKYQILQSDSWSLYQLELEWAEQGRDLIAYLKQHNS